LDFWDLTVVIFRRWKVSLPLLLLAIGATAFVALTAKPDYTMTSYVQFIPATLAPTDNAGNASFRNPWNQLGLSTLGQASIYSTQDQKFLDLLKAGHHTDNFTLTMNYPNPIVMVEVVAPTKADARETTELVINRLRATVQSLQTQSGVQDRDIIATQRLDQGENLKAAGGKVKRALAAVAAAGLLMVAGGALGFDALVRRRARKRQERESAGSPPTEISTSANGAKAPAEDKFESIGEPLSRPPAVVVPQQPPNSPVSLAAAIPAAERTAIVVKRSAPVVKPTPAKSRPPEAATYVSANAQSEASGDNAENAPHAANGDGAAVSSDVRVVLQPQRMGRDNGKKAE
jgi:hypothetical protein